MMKALKITGIIFVLACAAVLIAFFGLRFLVLGRFSFPSDSEYEAIAKGGQPILQAIYDYRSEHGLLPLEFSDLVPKYLPKVPQSGWRFDGNSLSHNAGIPRSSVSYYFVGKPGWTVYGEGINPHPLNVPEPVDKGPSLTGEALFAAQLAEYERRITRHPDKVFYGDKISFLGLAKRQDLLRPECQRAIEKFPSWWLPQMALAKSDASNPDAEKQFVAWVRQHESFVNYWYLARYYRDRGDTRAALAALEQAATSPYEQYPEDARWSGTAFAFDAAQFSYESGKYELTRKLCRHCEPDEGSMEGETLLAFVAAAELKLMQFESAISRAQRVVDIANQHPMETHVDVQNLPALLKAAKAHDTNFMSHFTIPAADSEFSLFLKPHP